MIASTKGISGLGQRMQSARLGLSMTQLELARKTGLKPSAISHFEVGARRPSVANLLRLCVALKCSSDYLIGL